MEFFNSAVDVLKTLPPPAGRWTPLPSVQIGLVPPTAEYKQYRPGSPWAHQIFSMFECFGSAHTYSSVSSQVC